MVASSPTPGLPSLFGCEPLFIFAIIALVLVQWQVSFLSFMQFFTHKLLLVNVTISDNLGKCFLHVLCILEYTLSFFFDFSVTLVTPHP